MNSLYSAPHQLEHVLAGFVTTDDKGLILESNSFFKSMLGVHFVDHLDKTYFHQFLSKGSQIYYQTHVIPLLRMHGNVKEINLDLKSENRSIPVLVNSSMQTIGGREYIQTTLFEISRRETYERELFYEKKKAESLAQKLNEANKELILKNEIIEAKKEEMAAINKQKDKIVGIMSHDFRSPLIELQSMIHLTDHYVNDVTKEELISMLAKAKDSVFNTVALADNLIEWSLVQLEKSSKNEEHCYLNQIIDEVLSIQLQAAKRKNITIIKCVDDDFRIDIPSGHVALVLRNLVNNAIKFTPEKGLIKIEGYHESKRSVLVVHDTGAGMNPDLIKSFQSHAILKTERGTVGEKGFGLGLFLVKDTIRSRNGNVIIKSEPNKGTTFEVIFPKA